MQKSNEMVKVETWILCLINFDSDEPAFYYNPVDDIFERKFNNKCGYWSEKSCAEKELDLNIDGLQMVKGTMDVPRDLLIDSIVSVFEEKGLIKKNRGGFMVG